MEIEAVPPSTPRWNAEPVDTALRQEDRIAIHKRLWSRIAAWEWASDRIAGRFLLLLLGIFLAKQIVAIVIFPPFSGHDEVAHFAYVQTVATDYRVPELLVDDIPDSLYRYCQYILDWTYPPCATDDPSWEGRPPPRIFTWGPQGQHAAGEQYAANHPPLYYLAAAPIYRLSARTSIETQQYLLRLLAIPFGLLTILLAFLTVHTAFPGDRFLAVVVPSLVAFQPQISYEAAMVNHDIAGIASISLILYLLVRGMRDRFPVFECALLGVALAISLLIKGSSLVILPIIALAMVLGIGWRRPKEWIPKGALVAGIGAAIVAPWYVYLYRTYGNLDALDQVEEMQQPWNQPAGTFFGQLFNRDFVWGRWQETWGAFGWRRIQLGDWLLWIIAIPVIAALVGLLLYCALAIVQRIRGPLSRRLPGFQMPNRLQTMVVVVSIALFVISYLAVIEFGTRFALTQARYLFPTVNAVAILLALGMRTLIPYRFRPLIQSLVVASLIMLNLVIYTKYVVPYWHLTDW